MRALPDLPEVDREMTLYWLRTVPEYRALIQARVTEAATKAERQLDKNYARLKQLTDAWADEDRCCDD
jgi:hypothetical protein